MKIAIQMFGHLRTYKQCYEKLFENLINRYDCDIFIHTWDRVDHNTQTWHDFHASDTGQTKSELIADIKNTYHPTDLMVETQNIVDMGTIDCDGKKISLFGMRSMLYGMKMANAMREKYQKKHRIKYDFVVVIRPDIYLIKPLNIESYIQSEDVDADILYTAGNYKRGGPILNDFRFIGGSDLCFFARPDIISKIYQNTDAIMRQIKNKKTSHYGPEYSFVTAIEKLKIRVLLINYLWFKQFTVLRPGDIQNTTRPIPKWLGRIICLFIPKRKNRHHFRKKYVRD